MLKYCLKKVGQLAIVMLLISFFSFAIIDLAPGDISSMYLTEDMTEEEKQIVIEKLGLDKSMGEQYLSWAAEALQGNFGVSLSYKTPVMPMLLKRLPSTILLMGTSLVVSLVLSIPLGLIAAPGSTTPSADLPISACPSLPSTLVCCSSFYLPPSCTFCRPPVCILSVSIPRWIPSST